MGGKYIVGGWVGAGWNKPVWGEWGRRRVPWIPRWQLLLWTHGAPHAFCGSHIRRLQGRVGRRSALPSGPTALPHPPSAGQPELAWQLYLQQQGAGPAGQGVPELLALIANDCYRAGAHLWAARAFDALEYLGTPPSAAAAGAVGGQAPPGAQRPVMDAASVWEGKRGACVAVFQAATQGEQPAEVLRCVVGA